MFLLPYSTAQDQHLIYSFACNWGQILSIGADSQMRRFRGLPPWPTPGWCGAMSAMGTSTLMMMSYDRGWAPEIAMFGGAQEGGGEGWGGGDRGVGGAGKVIL